MRSALRRLIRDRAGATAIEYAALVAALVLTAAFASQMTGIGPGAALDQVMAKIRSASGAGADGDNGSTDPAGEGTRAKGADSVRP